MVFTLTTWLSTLVRRVRDDERGQGMVEYGLILALVAVFVVGSLILLREELVSVFTDVVDGLQNRN